MVLLRQLVSSARRAREPLGWALAAGGLLLGLVACGGGDPVNEFEPERLLVFGDESSVITSASSTYPAFLPDGTTPHPNAGQATPPGLKYSVNGLDPTPAASAPATDNAPPGPIDCRAQPIWIQVLADEYGFGFEECNNDAAGTPQRGKIYAQAGARVQDIEGQIALHEATTSFTPRDLVTVLVGQRDIHDIHRELGKPAECPAAADEDGRASALGAQLAAQINRIANDGNGGRVLFVTVVRQGDTPYGRGAGRQCLNDLTDAFNAGLRREVVNDGRQIALVAISEQAEAIVDDPDRFRDFDNVSAAQCKDIIPEPPDTSVTPDCTTATLEEPGSDYLWADRFHFGPEFHDLLGDLAADRVSNDVPF